MTMTVRVQVRGLDVMQKEFGIIRKRIEQPFNDKITARRVMEVYADHATDMIVSHNRGRWPKLNSRYARYKQQVRPGRPMMVFDGHLSRALTDVGDRNFGTDLRPTRMTLWPRVPYAAYHQAGRGRLPVRKVIDLRQKDALVIGKTIASGLFRGMI